METPKKRALLPRDKWKRRCKTRVMVGTRSTPKLTRISRNTSLKKDDSFMTADGNLVCETSSSNIETKQPALSQVTETIIPQVKHGVDELKFYLETIQSGEKPEPVCLPITKWLHGVDLPPSTVSSVSSMESAAMWGGSTTSAQEKSRKQWLFSVNNPAVVRIRGPGDYTFDASAQDNDSIHSDDVVRVTVDCSQPLLGVGRHPKSHANMSMDSRSHAFKDVFMPPEKNPTAERRKNERLEERKLLMTLQAQGSMVSSHLEMLAKQGKPYINAKNGTVRVEDLKTELTKLFSERNRENDIVAMSKKDIDRLLFALPPDKLDSTGRVHIGRLLGVNAKSRPSKVPQSVKALPQKSVHLPNLNNRPYLDTTATFERVMVPDKNSALFAPPTMTYSRNTCRNVPFEQAQDKLVREKKLVEVGERQLQRTAKMAERKNREEEERALKNSARIEHKRNVAARYSTFLKKETLRRMKMQNKFALKMFLSDPPLRLDHRRHQYKQYIDDGTRERQVAEYNEKISKISRREWHRIFR